MVLRLGDVFSKLRSDEHCFGWVYFREPATPTLDTECLLVSDEDLNSDGDIPKEARQAGFLIEGLDTDSIKDCLLWAEQLADRRSSAVDLESFIYYWRFDAFLPYVGAPEPPPPEVAMLNFDREFYESLGPENMETPCRCEGCPRGAVKYSVFCRIHHFESIRKKDCPFDD
jgi:hypothetical protein